MEAICRNLVSCFGRRMSLTQYQLMHHNVTRSSSGININLYRSNSSVTNSNDNGDRLKSLSPFASPFGQQRFCSAMPPRAGSNFSGGPVNSSLQLGRILEREIQDEMAIMNSQLSMDRIPGFDIETDGADVKLTRRHGNNETVIIRFNVSSSLHEIPATDRESSQSLETNSNRQASEEPEMASELVSMPDFQVQIRKENQTLEFNCYFTEPDTDEETGAALDSGVEFDIQELVLYEGEPKENEFVVSTDFLDEEMSASLFNYLADRGIDDEFTRNMVNFATGYEKRQYIDLMERLKTFIK